MDRFVRLNWLSAIHIALWASLGAGAICQAADPPADHTVEVPVDNTWIHQYVVNCTYCHSIHGPGPFVPDSLSHAPGYEDPLGSGCTQCHGEDLTGGTAVSCYICHGNRWDPHDFSDEAWLPDGENHCYVCHLPPIFGQPGPFWNHAMSGSTYTVTNTTTAPVGQPNGKSAKCMACHEGRPDGPAVDAYGGDAGGDYFVNGPEAFGTDLTQHHPVSFDYLDADQGGLNDSTTTPSGRTRTGTIDQDVLEGGQVQCTSCHDQHDNSKGDYLFETVQENSCFVCHKFVQPDPLHHHIPGRDDPWGDSRGTTFNCTMCHGANLEGNGVVPACTDCHNDFVFPDALLPGHHGGDRTKPYFDCAACHADPLTGVLTGNLFGAMEAPSCFGCHTDAWTDKNHRPPTGVTVAETVDGFDHDGRPSTPAIDNVVVGTAGESVTFTAVVEGNDDGEILAYQWSFGDRSTPPFPSHVPTVAHTFDVFNYGDWYNASVVVTDGVNPPVKHEFKVFIGEPDAQVDDTWAITTATDSFSITFEDRNGSLVGVKDDGGLAFGVEFVGVIYWMELWMDLSGEAFWGTGDIYFGNIDREAGTMTGVVFDADGDVVTFNGTKP